MRIYIGNTTTLNRQKRSLLNTNFATDVNLLKWFEVNIKSNHDDGEYVSISEETMAKLAEDLLKVRENSDNIFNLFYVDDVYQKEYFKRRIPELIRRIEDIIEEHNTEGGYNDQYMYVVYF